MTRKSIQILLTVVAALILIIVAFQNNDRSVSDTVGDLLLDGLSDRANAATNITIQHANDESLTLQHIAGTWVVKSRSNYPADVGKLRQLIVALTEARILEEKTSKPELYDRLGVDDPNDGGSGTRVLIDGDDFSYTVILGETVQREHRYARVAGDATSYLIDRNPETPKNISDWLSAEIISIETSRISSISIAHKDGETIKIEKSSEESSDFDVLDIPNSRELSYPTIGNGIAGALNGLDLEDVRETVVGPADTTVVFDTWDGLRVSAAVVADEDEFWVAFAAEAMAIEPVAAANDDGGKAATPPSQTNQAAAINAQLSGWQYRLPEAKTNLLTRRWEDMLKTTDAE